MLHGTEVVGVAVAAVTSVTRPLWYFKCQFCGMSYVHQYLEALPLEHHLVCHRHTNINFLVDLVENWSRIEWQLDGDSPF